MNKRKVKNRICLQCFSLVGKRRNKFCNKKCYGLFMRGKSLDRISPSKKEYIRIVDKNSPLADKQGKVLLHRKNYYESKGVLFSDEVVHHIDENKRNNHPSNLEKLRRDEHIPAHHSKYWKQKQLSVFDLREMYH